MDRREYEYLQEELSKLLNKRLWCGRNEEQGYRNGVLAAKSKLKEVFYAQEDDEDERRNKWESQWAIENGYA